MLFITKQKNVERLQYLEMEVRALKEKNRDLEVFSRERSHALTHKNIRIAQLEAEIEEKVAQ
jgi:FtsZ-binding cell division protein ZapB